jgi:hypothetical protein
VVNKIIIVSTLARLAIRMVEIFLHQQNAHKMRVGLVEISDVAPNP